MEAARHPYDDLFCRLREQMVQEQLIARGIVNKQVITAFRKVSREEFAPPEFYDQAYEDHPLPIGCEQTISQPYIVAFMTQALEMAAGDRVLEIGTGSGYQTAILAELAAHVYSVEIIPSLHLEAKQRLNRLGCQNVSLKNADGGLGWPEEAPFEKIIVTASSHAIHESWMEQLKEGGRLIAPVGEEEQELRLVRKFNGKLYTQNLMRVRFVPLQEDTQA